MKTRITLTGYGDVRCGLCGNCTGCDCSAAVALVAVELAEGRRRDVGYCYVHGVTESVAELRARAAELAILETYHRRRAIAGHDYGAGQRGAELIRRRRELEDAGELEPPTRAELERACDRIAIPRARRALAEHYRRDTPATRRTIRTLRAIVQTFGRGPFGATALAELDELERRGPSRFA